jgi:hypothetical protein
MTKRAWLPRQGKAKTTAEWIVQSGVKVFAWLPVYTAFIVTLTFLIILFGPSSVIYYE